MSGGSGAVGFHVPDPLPAAIIQGSGGGKAVGAPAQGFIAPVASSTPNVIGPDPVQQVIVPQSTGFQTNPPPAAPTYTVLDTLGNNAFNLLAMGQARFQPLAPNAFQLVLNSTGKTPSGDPNAYIYSGAVASQYPQYVSTTG